MADLGLMTFTSGYPWPIWVYQGAKNKETSTCYVACLLVKVGMTGLEPATSRPPDACANQLRYIPFLAMLLALRMQN